MGCCMLLNYGLFSFLSGYFNTVDNVYSIVQLNIVFSGIVIGVAIVIMFILIPKSSVNNLIIELEGGNKAPLTPEQELAHMFDELDEDNSK